MLKQFLLAIIFLPFLSAAQPPDKKNVRAFPITDYFVDLNDSTKVVQVELAQSGVITAKQTGVLQSKYTAEEIRPNEIGFGRCHLIKGNYYYFTIGYNRNAGSPRAGDLVYISTEELRAETRLTKLSRHYIGLKDVFDSSFYNRVDIFANWSAEKEKAALDAMMGDIKYTADYFIKNSPEINVAIKYGPNKGKLILQAMLASSSNELTRFLDFVIANPRKYAGTEWKISEIFATWLNEGSIE